MKTTTRVLCAGMALVLGLHAALAGAGGLSAAVPVLLSAAVLGEPKDSSDDLLKKARQAMDAGDLKTAESLIAQAEKKGASGLFQMGDSPKKARAELDKRKAAKTAQAKGPAANSTAAQSNAKPSQKFAGSAKTTGAPVDDPFMGRGQAAAPQSSSHSGSRSASPDAKSRAAAFLTNGRKELAQNNISGASHWYRQAAEVGAAFGPNEDSPDRLAADIEKRSRTRVDRVAGGASALPPVGGESLSTPAAAGAAYSPAQPPFGRTLVTPDDVAGDARGGRSGFGSTSAPPAAGADPATRGQADRLLVAARRALATGDVRRAADFADQCKSLGVSYGPADDSPAKVEVLIRRHQDLASRGGQKDTEAYRHQHAELLMEQAEGLRRWKDYDEAERLASDAQAQRANFGPFDNKPENVLEKIAADRSGRSTTMSGEKGFSVNVQPERMFGTALLAQSPQRDGSSTVAKTGAQDLMRTARAAMARGDLVGAERLAAQADGLAPDSIFGPGEDRPGLVLLDIRKAKNGQGSSVVQAGAVMNAGGDHADSQSYPGKQAVYDRSRDTTRNVVANYDPQTGEPRPLEALPTVEPSRPIRGEPGAGSRLYQEGLQQLRDGKSEAAFGLFKQAWDFQAELDPLTRSRLQEQLQMLHRQDAGRRRPAGEETLADTEADRQGLLTKQVAAEVARQHSAAMAVLERDPRRALDILQGSRAAVENAGLEPVARDALLRRIDADLAQANKYVTDNQAAIDLNTRNKTIRGEVEGERNRKLETQDRLAQLVDEYNKAIDDRRYEDAEVLAKKARELDPKNAMVVQLLNQSRALKRVALNQSIADRKEAGVYASLTDVDEAAIPFTGPIEYPSLRRWQELTDRRGRRTRDGRAGMTERDFDIERRLSTPVSVKFKAQPLSEVITYLSKVTEVPIYLDPNGLEAEGITSDRPITIDLTRDVMLKSALKLILEPLKLNYVIKNEVLKITSEHMRDGEVYTKTYPVADLIIPIPNFVPGLNGLGLDRALQSAYDRQRDLGYSRLLSSAVPPAPLAVVASDNGANANATVNPQLLAQAQQRGLLGSGGPPATGTPQNIGFGPGGMGGGAKADFDTLIQLITSTIHPTTWDEVGGTGSVKGFDTNLSLVVSQTQEVHEEIADLLQQLRRLQDLQVTIEVRFITLRDDFFERIGLDFDFNIRDRTGLTSQDVNARRAQDLGPSITTGVDAADNTIIAPDLNIQFRQASFNAAIPPFANDPTSAATFGFAILSDIEAFFLIQAAQGDTRTNVLNAPKVTLFNGQQAFVSDTSQRPFVTSVIPVVGDFAAAQQPVIVVLSEGTSLTVQAVVSNDRRFVRLTVVPFFSQIGDVEEFTFTGSRSVTRGSNSADDDDNTPASNNNVTETVEGTTVQLPTFSFVTVSTTVSVPDGGTVLLGGIKRLSEGRNERGVPVLSKLPYVNRLFKNVGIGRSTTSLMMMVTPRIIIQEEEEEKLIGVPAP